MTEPTPRPWVVSMTGEWIEDAAGMVVADPPSGVSDDDWYANAELIVRCVNAHDGSRTTYQSPGRTTMTADIERDQALNDGYAIVETIGGWELRYTDPAMLREHTLAVRESFHGCVAAYESLCDGEHVEVSE